MTRLLSGRPGRLLPIAAFIALWGASAVGAQTVVAPLGTGTQADPYRIVELGNLAWMSLNARGAQTVGKHYSLMNDIDASDTANWNDNGTTTSRVGFMPIGAGGIVHFVGAFDGHGHVIRGMVINRPTQSGVGLFSILEHGARVSDLALEGGTVKGYGTVGFLAGDCETTVTNCSATGDVLASEVVGGLIGNGEAGVIMNCYATGAVTACRGGGVAGGLVGRFSGSVTNCHAMGAVSSPDGDQVGGLLGSGRVITNSYAAGAVSGGSGVGGLVGSLDGPFASITNCYATGGVVATDQAGGGLVGESPHGLITESYATGAVSGWQGCGGLIGWLGSPSLRSFVTVTDCYATGGVTAVDQAGGLVGYVNGGTIANCYAVGAVTTGLTPGGGLVGYADGGNPTITSSFWDVQTTGLSTSAGGTGQTGETTAQMKRQATFAGWDFLGVWGIVENTTYPFLRRVQYPPLAPVNVSPTGGAVGVPLMPTLAATGFVDRNTTDTHAASQWQVRAVSSPSSWTLTVFDSGATTAALIGCAVTSGALTWMTHYAWRVRYEDNHGDWSAWSTPTAFQTRDVPPTAPTEVAASKGAFADRVRVTWTGSPGASDFEVWRSTHPTIATATALATWAPGTTYYDMTAELGVIYYYWVVAAADATGASETAFSACDSGWAGTPAFPSNYRGALWLVH